jgi:hypothetical protein
LNRKIRCGVTRLHSGSFLLLLEAHAIGTLIYSGVCLMGAHLDLVQRAVVLALTMVLALANGTSNGLIRSTSAFHNYNLLPNGEVSICGFPANMQRVL